MIDPYLLLKWLHVVSSAVLFGGGMATAFYMWSARRTGDAATIARVGRMVVRADWIFTGTSGVVQPATGLALAHLGGFSLLEPWLVVSFGLYLLAFSCWAPVVWLQIRAQRLAELSAQSGASLGADYHRVMRFWVALGWPAFLGLLTIYWLMVSKPQLWSWTLGD